MNYGVLILPEHRWSVAKDIWKRAEELGFDHAWTYDHLAWRSLKDSAWFGTVPTLTAAALATEHIRIGTLVASPNFRHPMPFARDLITLDDISAGRLTVGIGAGSKGWDATLLGQPPLSLREKSDRFDEFVTLLDNLLRETTTTWQGQFYTVNEARTIPGCVQKPRIPFAIAAADQRSMRLAATFGDIWVTTGDRTVKQPLDAVAGARAVRAQMAQLDEACQQMGRDPVSLRRLVLVGPSLRMGIESQQAFDDTTGRYAEIGVTDFVVHWPRQQEPYAADLKTFEHIMSHRLTTTREPPS
ncbi:MAG: LLM class flavin-dependent oxidoreductase [Chloroflexi bacterium]|nr:LLM class flavin-dependent oxidoreductase [Chloroflexota bacterium]